ncbi:hypothetical protein GCM10007876_21080 [Litoribrevibacter albus]|uniref:Uncharacterized protein n=1 Tax=Litoribrevibacter albus TaxID=1473156 RepID=A0AA37SAE4_9GAMM|nr:hypothetical protein GCM10007876_21080 [Litoribrevibacter albus]
MTAGRMIRLLCSNPLFQCWLAQQVGLPKVAYFGCIGILKKRCGVSEFREFKSNEQAAEKLAEHVYQFNEYCKKIQYN